MMDGREPKLDNDVFFVCAVIENIARRTKNHRSAVVNAIKHREISRLLELADVYHCEPVPYTADNFIEKCGITDGEFDSVALCKYNVPMEFDIAKVYKRLILAVSDALGISTVDALIVVYNSWMSKKIEDFNSSMFYESPEYIYASFMAGEALV